MIYEVINKLCESVYKYLCRTVGQGKLVFPYVRAELLELGGGEGDSVLCQSGKEL